MYHNVYSKLFLLMDSSYLAKKYEEYVKRFRKFSKSVNETNTEIHDILKDFAKKSGQISYSEFITQIFKITDTVASEDLYKYDDNSLAYYLYTSNKNIMYISYKDYLEHLKNIYRVNEELKLTYGDMIIDDLILRKIASKEADDMSELGYLWYDFKSLKGKTIKEFLDKKGYLEIKEVNELKDMLDGIWKE